MLQAGGGVCREWHLRGLEHRVRLLDSVRGRGRGLSVLCTLGEPGAGLRAQSRLLRKPDVRAGPDAVPRRPPGVLPRPRRGRPALHRREHL